MQDMVESIGRNFERLLRWAYPGGLFLVLFYMSRTQSFEAARIAQPWGLVVGGLVAGFAIYLFQANVCNQGISLLFVWLRLDVNVVPSGTAPKRGFGWLARLKDHDARNIRKRWGSTHQSLNSYLDYAWGTYHATLLTGWLALVFYFSKEKCSVFEKVDGWYVVIPAVLFILGALWVYAHLCRVRFNEDC